MRGWNGKKETAPVGKLVGDFDTLWNAGCIQTGNDDPSDKIEEKREQFTTYFIGIMTATNQNPCNGCPVYNGGKCPAFKKHHTSQRPDDPKALSILRGDSDNTPGTEKYPGMTVSQIANMLGVSKSEVRRRKVAGTL